VFTDTSADVAEGLNAGAIALNGEDETVDGVADTAAVLSLAWISIATLTTLASKLSPK